MYFNAFKTVEPIVTNIITLADAKQHCRVTTTAEDQWFTDYIPKITDRIERVTQRQLFTATYRLQTQKLPDDYRYSLPHPPLISVSEFGFVVADGNTTITQTANAESWYVVDGKTPAELVFSPDKLTTDLANLDIEANYVEYIAGYGNTVGDLPEWVPDFALKIMAIAYANRAGLEGNTLSNPFIKIENELLQYRLEVNG